jgi:hypothetical protein
MACKYYVNGEWLEETEFKKLLNDGLLDQLVANQDFIIPGFNINKEFLKTQSNTNVGPVKLKVTSKVNSKINTRLEISEATKGQVVGEKNVKLPRKSPQKVIDDSNVQIKSENKRLGTNRKPNKLILITKIKGELKYGNASKEVIKSISDSSIEMSIKENMQEGKIYMLVPSAYGMSPVWLRNSMLGETNSNITTEVRDNLKMIFISKDPAAVTKAKKAVEKYLYQVSIERDGDAVTVNIKTENEVTESETFTNVNDLITYILGKYDGKGNYTGEINDQGKRTEAGRIARVNHNAFNDSKNKLSNKFYADNGFITTNVITEGGNFFNSASFIISAYQASANSKEMLTEVLSNPKLVNISQKIEENSAAEEVSVPKVENQDTKKDESPIYNMAPKDIKHSKDTDSLKVPKAIATKRVAMDNMKVMTEDSTISVQAVIYSEIKNGILIVSKIEKRTGIKKKGKSRAVWKVVDKPFSNKQKNKLIQDFFKNKAVIKFKEELALAQAETQSQEESQVENAEEAPFVTEEAQAIIDSMFEDSIPTPQEEDVDENSTILETKSTPEANSDNLNSLFNLGNANNGEAADENAEDSPKLRMTEEKVDGTTWSKDKEIKWITEKISHNLVPEAGRTSVFKTIEDLKEYLPQETYELLLESRKNGAVLHGLFTKAAVFLNENAFSGTGYHEAFHVVFNLALPLEKRLDILTEALELFPDEIKVKTLERGGDVNDPTYLDIEEALADKFMAYVQSAEATAPTLGQKIKNFFKALFRGIKLFFNRNSKVTIDQLFNDIQLGVYKNKANFKNTDLAKIDPSMVRFMRTNQTVDAYTQLDPRIELQAIRYMEYKFLNVLNVEIERNKAEVAGTTRLPSYHGKSDSEIIADIGIDKMYGLMLQQILDDRATREDENGNSNLDTILKILTDNNNPKVIKIVNSGNTKLPIFEEATPLLEKFNRSLRKFNYNIDLTFSKKVNQELDEESSLNEDVESSTFEERWQQSYIEINPQDTISQKIKRKLGTISKMKIVDGNKIVARNMFSAPEVYSEREVFSYIGQNITDSYTPTKMVETIQSLKDKKPFIGALLNIIESDASFKTGLFTTLASKTFQRFITIYEKNGEYQTFYSNRAGIDDIIKETLAANFLIEENKLFNKYPKTKEFVGGQTDFESINFDNAVTQLSRITEILENVLNTNNNEKEIIDELSKFLTDNNINITSKQLNEIWNPKVKNKKASWNNIKKLTEDTNLIFNELVNGRNPFLDLKATDQLSNGKESKSISSILENFARKLKPAMDEELILSFRNANNKTVYSIQYSNYLTKLISKFKTVDSFNEYFEKIKTDPLLKNMPLFKDLLNEDGGKTGLMDELQIVIFDGLAREGKSKSVEYSKLSDIEMEAVIMGAFDNQGSNSYGYFKLPIPSDSSTLPFIKSRKFNNEEVIDRLVQVALAETERINSFSTLPNDSNLRKLANYFKKGEKYQILSFLEGNIDPNAVTEDALRELIIEHLEGEFLELHKEIYKKAGIITSFKSGKNGKIEFADKVITKSKEKNSNEFFKNYLYNQYYMNTQMTTIFAGDPSFYNSTTNYQKRYKQVLSPGNLTNADLVEPTYNSIILADEEVPSSTKLVDDIISLVETNDIISDEKKNELISIWKSKDKNSENPEWNNTTDGFTFVSIDRMMQILDSEDRVTDKHEQAAERIKKGIDTPADAALFGIIKPFMFTKQYIDGVEVPIQVKNSEMLLTKAFAYRKTEQGAYKYPKLIEAHRILTEGIEKEISEEVDGVTVTHNVNVQVDSIMFESAVKVGGVANELTSSGKAEYPRMEINSDGTYSLNNSPNITTLQHSDWRRQQETPSHYQDEIGNFGTQLRNLIISDMDINGDYTISGSSYKGSEVVEMYQKLISENLEKSFNSVESMFEDIDGNIDYGTLLKHLKSEMESRGLGQEYFDAIAPIENPDTGKIEPTLPLWHPLIAYKVESLINSFFKNRVTKQKIKGGNMVNASSFGVSQDLKMKMGKDGNYQVEAMLPWWSKKYFPKDSQGKVNLDNLPDELKNIIGYRVPTEDKYSIFNIVVKGFTDSAAGGAIILPAEITFIAGLDFDIDKLFMIVPEFRKNNSGEIEYIKYIDETTSKDKLAELIVDSSESYENFVEEFISPKDRSTWILKKELADDEVLKNIEADKEFSKDDELVQLKKKIKDLKNQRRLEQNKGARNALSQQINESNDEVKELTLYSNAADSIFAKLGLNSNLILDLQKEIITVLESNPINKFNYESLNSTKSRNNRLFEIMKGIMENKNTALSVIDPGNFEQLKEIGSKIRIQSITSNSSEAKLNIKKKGLAIIKNFKNKKISIVEYRKQINDLAEKLDDKDFNINYPSTQLTLFRRNMTGKALIGIFANHNSHHAKAQHTSLRTDTEILFDSNTYTELNLTYKNGNRISKSIASKLAAVVDNASDPVSSYLNMNMYTADLIALLSRLGVSEDTIFAFVNQPIITELTTRHFNEKGSLVDEQQMISKLKGEWKTKMLAKSGLNKKEIENLKELSVSKLDFTLNDLEKSLDQNGSKEYYIMQYKVLLAFEEHLKTSAELSAGVQATRVDTKPVGPTYGDNYAMVNRQAKLLSRENPRILGINQMLQQSSNQIINPAFNKYAWIKAITLMNKIFPAIGKIDETNGKISYSTIGRIKNFFSDLKDQSYSITEKEAREIDTALMTYMGSAMPFFKYKGAKDILENTPEKLSKYKKNHPDSPFSPLLDQLYSKDADKSINMRRIVFYNNGKQSIDNEAASISWKMMLDSKDQATKELALDLIKYTYFAKGYAFGPFTFFNLIPVHFWTDSFALSIENKDIGMLDSKGRTFNTMTKLFINELAKTSNEESLIDSKNVKRFVKQFAQNTAAKSMIIKTIDAKDSSDRKYAPLQKFEKLAPNEVYVFSSTNLGTHNAGEAGWAFNDTPSGDNLSKVKGSVGKWAEYGVTGKMMKGNSGVGFALRTQNVEVIDGKVNIIKSNTLSKTEKTAQMSKFISDLTKLVVEAEARPGVNFIVGNLAKNTGWSIWNIKQAFIEVMDEYNLPDNIILPKTLEVRDFGSAEVDANQIMKLHKASIIKSNPKLLVNDKFPSFLKTSNKGEVKLFKLISSSDSGTITKNGKSEERPTVYYKRLPLLGTPNFVSEYDYFNDIEESLVSSLTKKSEDKLITKTETQLEIDTLLKETSSTKEDNGSKWALKPENESDVGDLAKLVTNKIDTSPKKVPYEDFLKLVKEKGLGNATSKEKWDAETIDVQNTAMEQIKKC